MASQRSDVLLNVVALLTNDKALRPAKYDATVVATDAAGHRSDAVSERLKVVKAGRS